MFMHSVSAYSEVSESDALAKAVASARAFAKDTRKVHIFVTGVFQSGDGWNATANVVSEPEFAVEDEFLRKAEEFAKIKKVLGGESEALAPEEIEAIEDAIFLYLAFEHEELARESIPNYLEDYIVHVIDSKPLWHEALTVHPEMEFYESVHDMHSHIPNLGIHFSNMEPVFAYDGQ